MGIPVTLILMGLHFTLTVQSYAPTSSLLGSGAVPSANAGDPNPKYSMFNLKSYRKYFNVDTQVCQQRPLNAWADRQRHQT